MNPRDADRRVATLERLYHDVHRRAAAVRGKLIAIGSEPEAEQLRSALAEAEKEERAILLEVAAIEDSLLV